MSLTRADVIAYLEGLDAGELDEFIAALQARLHLQPPARQWVTMGAPAVTMGMPLDEPTYAVELVDFGANKVEVVRAVRELWPLGVMQAMRLVESAPVRLRDDLDRHEAARIAERLRSAGAKIRVD